ncbi:MAG: hypothetical protein KC561_06425 [Myxococcales bacterium]|nr:hypothetical protein [Myxococcales bacterium]
MKPALFLSVLILSVGTVTGCTGGSSGFNNTDAQDSSESDSSSSSSADSQSGGSDSSSQSGGTDSSSSSTALSCEGTSKLAHMWGTVARGELLDLTIDHVPGADWPLFIHPTQPLLGFQHPANWTPTAISGGSDVGVDLIRNDNGGFYHYYITFDPTGSPVGTWLDASVVRGFQALADDGERSVLCSLPPTTVPVGIGGTQIGSAAVVLTDDTVLLTLATLTFFDGLAGNSVSIQSYGARRTDAGMRRIRTVEVIEVSGDLLDGRKRAAVVRCSLDCWFGGRAIGRLAGPFLGL